MGDFPLAFGNSKHAAGNYMSEHSRNNCLLGSVVWTLSLGISHLGTFVWDPMQVKTAISEMPANSKETYEQIETFEK